jgi:hypothetical protein
MLSIITPALWVIAGILTAVYLLLHLILRVVGFSKRRGNLHQAEVSSESSESLESPESLDEEYSSSDGR